MNNLVPYYLAKNRKQFWKDVLSGVAVVAVLAAIVLWLIYFPA